MLQDAEKVLREIIPIIREAGRIMTEAVHIEETAEEKSGRANFVTEYDKRVQSFLFQKLAKVLPKAGFIGEEEEEHPALLKGDTFIIDPIDGTTNFMKGYCTSCISVGLLNDGVPQIGVVYNPYLEELFSAVRGKGAFLNGKSIHVSEHSLKEGLVLFGTAPYNAELSKESFRLAYELFTRSLDIRRSGSAAIDLCSIACGRAELYFELLLSPWDYAAGALIVEEAGGQVMSTAGEELSFDRKMGVVAGNQNAMEMWQELQRLRQV